MKDFHTVFIFFVVAGAGLLCGMSIVFASCKAVFFAYDFIKGLMGM